MFELWILKVEGVIMNYELWINDGGGVGDCGKVEFKVTVLFRCSDSLPTGEGWGEASFTGTKIQKYFLNSKNGVVQMREHPLNSIHLTVK